MSKWRTVRDNYVRNLKKHGECFKSGSAAKKVKRYIYGEQLSFLKKNLEQKATTSSMEIELDTLQNSENDDGDGVEAECVNETATPPRNPAASRKKKQSEVERSLISFMQAHSKRNTLQEDDDLAFFYSLLPTVRELTSDEKITFRLQTMQFLQNIKARRRTPNPSIHQDIVPRPQSNSSTASYFSNFSPDIGSLNNSENYDYTQL